MAPVLTRFIFALSWFACAIIAVRREISSSRKLWLFLYIYIVFHGLYRWENYKTINISNSKLLYVNKQLIVINSFVNAGHARQLRRRRSRLMVKQRPLPNSEKLVLGCRFIIYASFAIILICLSGDVETNPGPTIGIPPARRDKRNNMSNAQRTNLPSGSTTDGLNTLYLNARSLKAFVPLEGDSSLKICKISLLQQLVHRGAYDVICICETWLNDSIMNNELLPGYSIFRRDRVGKVGGGVLVAVKANIHATRRLDREKDSVELVVVELVKTTSKAVILYTFYRPPGSESEILQQLNSSLQNTPESSCIVLVGDFNLPAIDWSADQTIPTNTGGHLEDTFCDLVGDNFLQQFIKGPTHNGGNKLDLLFYYVTVQKVSRMYQRLAPNSQISLPITPSLNSRSSKGLVELNQLKKLNFSSKVLVHKI